MKTKKWILGWFAIVIVVLSMIIKLVYDVDPYFHYHAPDTDKYYYTLNNERSQNDGISKHFAYDAIITGTSMTENFKASEMDAIFGTDSIKVPYSGGSYKEINDNLVVALENNPEVKTIVRGLDYDKIFDDKDVMRNDLGEYPIYLYDDNVFNDAKYIFNKDVIFGRVAPMIYQSMSENSVSGITSFDDYSRWQYAYTFGGGAVLPVGMDIVSLDAEFHLSEKDKETIYGNITQNVTSLADKYPEVEFYYFFSPYSVAWWGNRVNEGTIYKWIEAEQYVIELILEHENIHLYSFNTCSEITTDLNNYKDTGHYGQWVNSLMLQWMHDGKYLLTEDNYLEYLTEELELYTNFDYASLNNQEDYESDFYAAALLNEELTGAKPINLMNDTSVMKLNRAEIVADQYEGSDGILCRGALGRNADSEASVWDYLYDNEYIGAKIEIDDLDGYNYLVFYGKKVADHGQASVYVYNSKGEKVGEASSCYANLDNEWHQYVIDLSSVEGGVTIIFNGGYTDNTGADSSEYVFSGITLY